MAAVGGVAAALRFEIGLGLPADLGGVVILAFLEVIGRIGAGFVDDIGQDVGAVCRESFPGDRMFSQAFHKGLVGCLEPFRVRRFSHLAAVVVQNDHLDALGAHDRADAAAARMARRPELPVGDGDGRCTKLHLAGRSDGHHGHFIAVQGAHLLGQIVIGRHLEFVGRGDLHLVFVDENFVEIIGLALAFEDDRRISQPGHDLAGLSAGVRFLDAAGQRAFAADRDPSGRRSGRSGHQAGSDDEFVFGPQGMAIRRHFGADHHGGHRPAAHTGICAEFGHRCFRSPCRTDIDTQNFIHDSCLLNVFVSVITGFYILK